jgi:hypothetical protein
LLERFNQKGTSVARLKKKKIRWERSANSVALKYRVYWAIGKNVGYDSDYIELHDVTEVILPRELSGPTIG